MTTPNPIAEPTVVAEEVAAANATATDTPPEQPEKMAQDELANEFNVEEPKQAQPPVSDESRNRDRQVREAKFSASLAVNLNKVTKGVENGEELDDILSTVPQHLQGKIRKIVDGEDYEEPKQEFNQQQAIDQGIARARSIDKAQDRILTVIGDNGLNIQTAEAKMRRENLIADYQRLLKANAPEEAAKFAIFNSGLANKQSNNEAFENGVKHGNMSAPMPGQPGHVPQGEPQIGVELTAEQIKTMDFDKMVAHDKKISEIVSNNAPIVR